MDEPGGKRCGETSRESFWPAAVVAAVFACSAYANLSYLVTDPDDYRYFPPFLANVDRNGNTHLGGENLNIARALADGRGFADPFGDSIRPTAWMAPVLPALQGALLWLTDGDTDAVAACVVLLQNLTLIATGLLVLALARRTTARPGVAGVVFLVALLSQFRLSFQFTHDCWLLLLLMDLLVAGLVWLRPLGGSRARAAGWGVFGGVCALASPVLGLTWGVLSLAASRRGARRRLLIAGLTAAAAVAPWVVRNYQTFGRFIPVKSNLAFELYQSQCMLPTGVLHASSFATHPYSPHSAEGQEYRQLGETAYLDRKREQFLEAVCSDPADFARRVGQRLLAATLVYTPVNPEREARAPWALWLSRLTHPLPFLALVALLVIRRSRPLSADERVVVGAYPVFLLPYVLVSYYDRYTFPLLLVNVLLVAWAADRLAGRLRGRA